MKKSLLAFGAAWVAISGMGATTNQLAQALPLSLDIISPIYENVQPLGKLHAGNASGSQLKAPAKLNSSEDVITEASGSKQPISVSGSGYYMYGTQLRGYNDVSSIVAEIVYGDGDDVYLMNILPNAVTNTYIKGVKDGDKIVVDLPQTLLWMDDSQNGFNLAFFKRGEVEQEGMMIDTYLYDESRSSVTFNIGKDGVVSAEIDDDYLLGLSYSSNDIWAGYGAYDLSWREVKEPMVTLPSGYGAVPGYFYYDAGDYGYPVTWAPGDGVQYFCGISEVLPDAWIMGNEKYTADGVFIEIPQNQYIGTYQDRYYITTKAAKLIYNEGGALLGAELMPDDYQYELVWDMANNVIKAKDPDVALVLNASETSLNYLQLITNLKLVHQNDFAGTPANPNQLSFFDKYQSSGYGNLFFSVPAVSTEGTLLKTEDLYYVAYVDGEEWTFEPEEYATEEPIEEIPWNLGLYYIYNLGGSYRQLSFFVEGFTTLGIQSVYKYNGVETRSDIVSIDIDTPQAVDAIAADKKIADVKYYDLSGREVSDPAAGIFVKRVTFADGTSATLKKAIK